MRGEAIMIIDLILDRKYDIENGVDEYDAHKFYTECVWYDSIFWGVADGIIRAMDCGTEDDVKKELCEYIVNNSYNSEICDFVKTVNWLN